MKRQSNGREEIETDDAHPRVVMYRGGWATLVLSRRSARWVCVAWFAGNGPAVAFEIKDPSGLGAAHLSVRVRLAVRRAPSWVVRLFDSVVVVGDRNRAPVLEVGTLPSSSPPLYNPYPNLPPSLPSGREGQS